MDAAGLAAAKRGIDVALAEGMNIRVIQIPPGAGKDPDECVKKNPEVWQKAVKDASDIMAWYVSRAFAEKDVANPKQKQQIASELLPNIAMIPFAVERDHWLREVASRLSVDVSVLREDLKLPGDQNNSNSLSFRRGVRGEVKKDTETIIEPRVQTRCAILLERLFSL